MSALSSPLPLLPDLADVTADVTSDVTAAVVAVAMRGSRGAGVTITGRGRGGKSITKVGLDECGGRCGHASGQRGRQRGGGMDNEEEEEEQKRRRK